MRRIKKIPLRQCRESGGDVRAVMETGVGRALLWSSATGARGMTCSVVQMTMCALSAAVIASWFVYFFPDDWCPHREGLPRTAPCTPLNTPLLACTFLLCPISRNLPQFSPEQLQTPQPCVCTSVSDPL